MSSRELTALSGADWATACVVAVLLSQGVTGWSLLFPVVASCLILIAFATIRPDRRVWLDYPRSDPMPYLAFALLTVSGAIVGWRVVSGSDVPIPVVKDALRSAVLCALVAIALHLPRQGDRTAGEQLHRFLIAIACAGATLSVLGFVKLVRLAYGLPFLAPVLPGYPYPGGTSTAHDYNFYALSVACGVIACAGLWSTDRWRYLTVAGAGIGVGAGLLSGSRRFALAVMAIALLAFLFPRLLGLVRTAVALRLAATAVLAGTLFGMAQLFFVQALNGELNSDPALRSGQADTLYIVGRLSTLSDAARAALASIEQAVGTGIEGAGDGPIGAPRGQGAGFGKSRPGADSPEVIAARLDRWRFGLELFLRSGNTLVGEGFGYGSLFADRFQVHTGYDYPHNLLISALLYGGLVAMAALVMLMFVSLWMYLGLIRRFGQGFVPLAAMYFVVGFYCLVSGDTFFSMPVLGVFVALPVFFRRPLASPVGT